MNVLEHPDLGIAQAVKQILTSSLARNGVIGEIHCHHVTLTNISQARDFAKLAINDYRKTLQFPKITSDAIANWDELGNFEQPTFETNGAISESRETTLQRLDFFREIDDSKLASFHISLPSEIVYEDEQLDKIASNLRYRFDGANSFRLWSTFNHDDADAQRRPQYCVGVGVSIAQELLEGKPLLLLTMFRNSIPKGVTPIHEVCDKLDEVFGARVRFRARVLRWPKAKASIYSCTSGGCFTSDYFTRPHSQLRPGISLIANKREAVGSLCGVFQVGELCEFFGCDLPKNVSLETRYAVGSKHVFYSDDATPELKRLSRPWKDGTVKPFADILQPARSNKWYVDFVHQPVDIAFAKVVSDVEYSPVVIGSAQQDFTMRLANRKDNDCLIDAKTRVVSLGSAGAHEGVISDFDGDFPYIFKRGVVSVFLHATGLRLVRSTNKKIAREGVSGGPVIVDKTNGDGGSSNNVIVGVVVAGDEGKTFTNIYDTTAPFMLFQPIQSAAAIFREILALDDLGIPPQGNSPNLQQIQESPQTIVEKSRLDELNKESLDIKRASTYSHYMSISKKVGDVFFEKIIQEVRAAGGLIIGRNVREDTSGLVLEFFLANRQMNSGLRDIEMRNALNPRVCLIAGMRSPTTLGAHLS
jgi:hypothetical protein